MAVEIYNLCNGATAEHFCFSLRTSAHSAVNIELIPA
jgi:hypothetical protein